MNNRLARVVVIASLVLSPAVVGAYERQDLKEINKVGNDVRKSVDELRERADANNNEDVLNDQ